MEGKIEDLESLISDYKEEQRKLVDMIDLWENHGDPGSDPGLQYEQENIISESYNKIKEFALTL